jgi:hypothetical protein
MDIHQMGKGFQSGSSDGHNWQVGMASTLPQEDLCLANIAKQRKGIRHHIHLHKSHSKKQRLLSSREYFGQF